MYPKADIPIVSLSISPNLSFTKQYEIGKSLSSLKEDNVLIIGSGGLVHNLDHIQYICMLLKDGPFSFRSGWKRK